MSVDQTPDGDDNHLAQNISKVFYAGKTLTTKKVESPNIDINFQC